MWPALDLTEFWSARVGFAGRVGMNMITVSFWITTGLHRYV